MPPSNKSSSGDGFFAGKLLVRLMILLGIVSVVMNFRYYVNSRQEMSQDLQDHFLISTDDSKSSTQIHTAQQQQQDESVSDQIEGRKGKRKRKTGVFDGEFAGGQLVKRNKKGEIVVNRVTALNKDELVGDVADDDDATASLTLEEASVDREHLINMLKEAGIQEFDAATVAKLPTMTQIEKLYGKGPIVYGKESCKRFREMVPPEEASVASAGIFNSGTNTLAMYMNANCIMPENKKERYGGMRWQVPWGKHMVAKRRLTNTVKSDKKVNKTTVMPIVAIRDPYSWMQSMCRHPYAAKWHHSSKHCPNLVPNQDDLDLFPYLEDTIPVSIKYPERPENWDSLAHVWSDWYGQYFRADYPVLMIRFEDLLFNVKEMVDQVCECVGGVRRSEQFAYIVDSGKYGDGHPEHGVQHTNLISAMVKYGTDKKRFTGMTDEDLTFAYETLDAELMAAFQYEVPPPPP